MNTNLPGGYSNWNFNIPKNAQKLFAETMEPILGVEYKPLAYATQVVAGTNYTFLCHGTVVIPGQPSFPGLIHIFQPLNGGDPELKGIDGLAPSPSTGFEEWTPWSFGPDATAMEIFKEARGTWAGQKYEMLAFASKLTSGIHRFLMKASSVTANPVDSVVEFDVQVLLGGKPIIIAQREVSPVGKGLPAYT